MQLEQTTARSAAGRFFKSRHPIVLLGVPECSPRAISPAHWRSPHLGFDSAGALQLTTESEYLSVVNWIATNDDVYLEALRPETQKALRRIACYCAEVGSILALRGKDCVHEAHFQQFRDYAGKLVSLAGWEFNLDPPASTLTRRVYRVLRTHSRLLAYGQESDALKGVQGLLEVRFVPSAYLVLVVDTIPGKDLLVASVQLANIPEKEIAVVPESAYPIVRENLNDYSSVEQRLIDAAHASTPVEFLRNEAARLQSRSETSYAEKELFANLLDPGALGKPVDDQVLRERMLEIRARLWDAPVIAGNVRNRLEGQLMEPSFLREIESLPLHVRLDFATLTMPLSKLEAGDEYLLSDAA